jgi:hypothetical protein
MGEVEKSMYRHTEHIVHDFPITTCTGTWILKLFLLFINFKKYALHGLCYDCPLSGVMGQKTKLYKMCQNLIFCQH